jgi:predicted nucleic acid-binding protein
LSLLLVVELADKAKQGMRRMPSLFDALVLATDREYHSEVVTGDEDFKGLPETVLI